MKQDMIYCDECRDPVYPDEDGQKFRGNKKFCPLCLMEHNKKSSRECQRRKREANRLKRPTK